VSEDDLIAAVGALCVRHQLLWAHFTVVYRGRRDIHGCYGFPDLVIAGPGGILFRECKSAGGKLRREQRYWSVVLGFAGGDWAVWQPADLDSGRIEDELQAIA